MTVRHHGRSQNFFDGVCQNLTGWAKIIFSQRLINSLIDFNIHCYFNKLFVAIYHCFIRSKIQKPYNAKYLICIKCKVSPQARKFGIYHVRSQNPVFFNERNSFSADGVGHGTNCTEVAYALWYYPSKFALYHKNPIESFRSTLRIETPFTESNLASP